PQRREILARLGLEFEVRASGVEEVAGGDPEQDVLTNARRKARAVAAQLAAEAGTAAGADSDTEVGGASPAERVAVIGCDTDVVLDGRILGKPADAAEAAEHLRRLSGRTHEVLSALVIASPGDPAVRDTVARHAAALPDATREAVARTQVTFHALSEATIAWYLDIGEWRDRAGGYAIQGYGSALVASVDGDVTNVIGLPVPILVELVPGLIEPHAVDSGGCV
ncbi:MAG TPA: nucleoside triphosphate pyrophosphatase, partial [Solirubrobacterales bacterium]|nr:nucleoside triphosphate pyrophosphatase [Solirubrobacterales bacterium]